jgi:hypothetical protein
MISLHFRQNTVISQYYQRIWCSIHARLGANMTLKLNEVCRFNAFSRSHVRRQANLCEVARCWLVTTKWNTGNVLGNQWFVNLSLRFTCSQFILGNARSVYVEDRVIAVEKKGRVPSDPSDPGYS